MCNLQLEFQKITPFGHALPPHGHSGRFWAQSACKVTNYREKKLFPQTDGQTDGQTSRTTTIGSFFEKRKKY